jgi:hypothetical protein
MQAHVPEMRTRRGGLLIGLYVLGSFALVALFFVFLDSRWPLGTLVAQFAVLGVGFFWLSRFIIRRVERGTFREVISIIFWVRRNTMKRCTYLQWLLIFVILFVTGCNPTPVNTPEVIAVTPTETPTAIPKPNEPTATATPEGKDQAEALTYTYQRMVLIRDNAEQAKAIADQANAGMFPGMDLSTFLIMLIDLIRSVDTSAPAPEALQAVWVEALTHHEASTNATDRWSAGMIGAQQASAEYQRVMEAMDGVLAAAEGILAGNGFTAEQITYLHETASAVRLSGEEIYTDVENDAFEILDHNSFLTRPFGPDIGGDLVIVGLVMNHHSKTVTNVEFTVNLLDNAGSILATKTSITELIFIEPGRYSPFEITFPKPIPEWKTYQITFKGREQEGSPFVHDFEVFSHTESIGAFGELDIHGQIRNNGAVAAQNAFVIVAVYNAQGKIVAVGYLAVQVQAGEVGNPITAPGEIDEIYGVIQDWAGGPEALARYEFLAEGTPK